MIEEIKKEIEKESYNENFYTKVIQLEDLFKILDKYKDIDKYKNAWEENKKVFKEHYMTWCVNMSGAETRKEINTCEKWKKYWEEKISELEKLEAKHNIGREE